MKIILGIQLQIAQKGVQPLALLPRVKAEQVAHVEQVALVALKDDIPADDMPVALLVGIGGPGGGGKGVLRVKFVRLGVVDAVLRRGGGGVLPGIADHPPGSSGGVAAVA